MPRPSVLLATLAVLLCSLSLHASAVAVTNAPSAITVNARGCSAVEAEWPELEILLRGGAAERGVFSVLQQEHGQVSEYIDD